MPGNLFTAIDTHRGQAEDWIAALPSRFSKLVDHVTFTVEEKRLDLHIKFPAGSRFARPVCDKECPVHDTRKHTWRHMGFFLHEAYLQARVPRVKRGAWGSSDTRSLGQRRLTFHAAL